MTTEPPDPDLYVLVLRPEPPLDDGWPMHRRMRALLKVMLRRFGVRCVEMRNNIPVSVPPSRRQAQAAPQVKA